MGTKASTFKFSYGRLRVEGSKDSALVAAGIACLLLCVLFKAVLNGWWF